MDTRIVILAGDHDTTPMVYHSLATEFSVVGAVVETPVSGWQVLRRRARRLGWLTAFGQALFVKLAVPLLKRTSAARADAIREQHALSAEPIPGTHLTHVTSVNSQTAIDQISNLAPTHIVVNGTRLLSKKFLAAFSDTPIINIHLGINPRYRGGNGGYWALVMGEPEHCGVTVHLIDAGVDTGDVLARGVIEPTSADTFVTYPLLQLATGLTLLTEVLKQPQLQTVSTAGEPSAIWYHPTVWAYLWHRLYRGVK